MKIHYIALGILVIGLFATAGILYMNDLSENYGRDADFTDFQNSRTAFNKTIQDARSIEGNITNFQLKTGLDQLFNVPYVMLQLGWSMTRTFWSSVGATGAIATDLETATNKNGIPLPVDLSTIIIAAIILIVGAAVLFALFKWKIEDR